MSFTILFSDEKVTSVDEALAHLSQCGVWDFFDERAVSFINKFNE